MPAKTPSETIAKIISLRFEGHSKDEIADIVNVSKRTAHRRLSEFKTKCEEVGILDAAKTNQINVDDLYKLAEEKKASSLSFDQLQEGVTTAKAAKQLGYNLKTIGDTMTFLVKSIIQERDDPSLFAANAYRLVKASEQLGCPYQEAVEKHEKLVQDIALHRREEKLAREKKDKAQEELTNKLNETGTTLETLSEFLKTKEKLGAYGMEISETHPLAVLLDNVAEYTDNPVELVNHYKTTINAQAHTDELKKNMRKLETETAQLTSRTEELSTKITEQELRVKAAQTLADADITPEDAATLANTVREISARNHYQKSRALEKLRNDLTEYYDPILGFESTYNLYTARIEGVKETLTDIETVRNRFKEDHAGDLEAINSLRVLNQKGVGNDDLITYNQILHENNLDAYKLKQEITKLKGLPQAVENLRSEFIRMTAEKEKLQYQNEEIIEKNKQFSITSWRLEEKITRKLETLTEEFQVIIAQIEDEMFSPETGLKTKTVDLVKETINEITDEMGKSRRKLLADIDKLDKAVIKSETKVNSMIENSYDAGKLIGTLVDLDSVTKLIQGKKLSDLEGVIAIVAMTISMLDYLNRIRYNKSANSLNSFLDTYRDETNARKVR